MTKSFQNTRLWQTALSNLTNPTIRDLVKEYEGAWDRACALGRNIASDAPGLTLHDERHFEALWHDADLLVGDCFQLNAIEVFVFGMAILIHDAAHTTLAYEGGLVALSRTPEWADNLAARLPDDGDDAALPALSEMPEELKRAVLFDTVRALHAIQATKVLRLPFRHPSLGSEFYLIQDPTLRNHLGEIIGKIAASHHWNLRDVAALQKVMHVPSPYNSQGGIRPLLLAGLMRTADAIQIDGSRAPDFEFALAKPEGVSHDHWTAQNRLAKGIDATDRTSLAINSTAPFPESEANAWWVAYDLAKVADRELRNTDALLRDCGQPRLRLIGVKDVAEPARFATHVQTDGWYPVSAEIKVGDTARLVELLGGKGLYGRDDLVPVRELIQNAIDAVRARRLVEPGFSGKVTVTIEPGSNRNAEQGYWLRVADNGIGMSEAILAGPFLTFGESGWSSAALRRQRPGFVGRRFSHIGRFGIGFFSVFMISDEIRVMSRPFDEAHRDAKLLHFRSGLGLRPIVKDARQTNAAVVTSVEVFISEEVKKRILFSQPAKARFGKKEEAEEALPTSYSMVDVIGMLCPSIDVDIEGFDCDSGVRGVVGGDWISCAGRAWLARINGASSDEIPKTVTDNIALLSPVGRSESPIGRAALNPAKRALGAFTVGGMGSRIQPGVVTAPNHVGTIDRLPDGPRREPGGWRKRELVSQWATAQVEAWAKAQITAQERNFIAANACAFGGDPLAIANAQVDDQWYNIEQLYQLLLAEGAIYAPIRPTDGKADVWAVMDRVNLEGGRLYHPDDIKVERKNVLLAGETADIKQYWSIPNEGLPDPNSIFGLLGQTALAHGKVLEYSGEKVDFGYYKGPTIPTQYRKNGERISLVTIILRLLDGTTANDGSTAEASARSQACC
ncbi:ATP-binding protein [Rhizobium mongolense]|uniref:HD domain-containing protein n=1 Tax=Rhizobium mongolense TaxID=57676 RepID=UPI0035585473